MAGRPVAAWPYRIAANGITDHVKRTGREQAESEIEAIDESNPEDDDRRALLFQLVDRLPTERHRVVVPRFGEGMRTLDIAGELGRRLVP